MKKSVKRIIAGVLALAAAGGIVLAVLAPVRAETVILSLSGASDTFTEQGIYTYDSSYAVYPLVSGEVLDVRVEKGDTVMAGDVLAVVDAVDYREQIGQLTASLAGYDGQLANLSLQDQQLRDSNATQLAALQGQLATLREEKAKNSDNTQSLEAQIIIQEDAVSYSYSGMRRAREDLSDARDTGDEALISQTRQAYNAARNALAQNQLLLEQLKNGEVREGLYTAQEEALQAQIDSVNAQSEKSYTSGMRQYYNAQIEVANLTIAQLEERAGRAEILAAVSGTVESLPIRDQNMITQQQAAAVIGSGAYVEVFVPVREIDSIAAGTRAELILDKRLGSESINGTVIEVSDEAEPKLSPLGVEERKVRVLIEPEGGGLRIGYTVDARFTVWERENALTVPKTAVFTVGEADYVWGVRAGKLARIQVEKGTELRDAFLIASGLSEGDEIVLDADNEALEEGKAIEGYRVFA